MSTGRFLAVLGGVFGLVGVVLVTVAVVLTTRTAGFLADAERTEGTVVDVSARTSTARDSNGYLRQSTSYYPTVEFTADGRRFSFTSNVGTNPSAYEPGDSVPVAYDPASPSSSGQISTFGSAYLAPLIVGGLAVVFTPLGAGLSVAGWRRLRRQSWLRRHGQATWTDTFHVDLVTTVRINGRHPYVIRATWQDPRTGQTHEATSDHLPDDPTPLLEAQPRVRVLFDPDKPQRSLVDLGPHTT